MRGVIMAVFNEDTRIKIPATIQYLKLGYKYQSLRQADVDFNTKIFINRFKPSLEKINGRSFTFDEIKEILMDIDNVIKNHDLGKEFYNWLINPLNKVKLIDFENIYNNDFAVEALKNARDINHENDRLAENYGGNFGFVKTYQDAVEIYNDADKKDIEKMLLIAYQDIKDKLDNDILIIQGRKNFIDSIKQNITKVLLKEKLYLKVKNFYDQILSELYTNIQWFK